MENDNILSKEELVELMNKHTDHATVFIRKNYNHTYNFINSNFTGNKFTEKIYKYVYGEKHCKQCNILLTSNRFRSFFDGYCEEFCSKKCAYKHPQRIQNIKQTSLIRYGVENPFQNKIFQDKYKATMLQKYGVTHNWNKNSPLRENCYLTNLKLHGSRNWNNQEQYKATMFRKYGVEHPSHHDEFIKKIFKCRWKSYITPSGKQIKIQGYENFALNELFQNYKEDEIITERSKMPTIFWKDETGKNHRYYPDIFIEKENRFIEVKSPWIWKLHENLNFNKIKSVKEKGFKIDILIYNSKGNLTEKKIY